MYWGEGAPGLDVCPSPSLYLQLFVNYQQAWSAHHLEALRLSLTDSQPQAAWTSKCTGAPALACPQVSLQACLVCA